MDTIIDWSDLINLTKAARYLDISYVTIHRWKKNGKIKVVYAGEQPFIQASEIARLLEERNSPLTTP